MKKCTKCGIEKPNTLEFFIPQNTKEKKRIGAWCRECSREIDKARRFGITREEVRELMSNNNCEICEIELTKKCIDHCHKTGKVRGVLCDYCNRKLGFLEQENDKFYKYLEKYAIN